MANPTIQLDNTTVSVITLTQLGIAVPGSGSIMATVSVLVNEVVNDPQLNTLVDSGDITLTVDAVTLTAEQSKAYIGYNRLKSNLSATVAPGINDDADAGYSVGSGWVDVTADTAYFCVDATNNTAVWVATAGAAAFATPVTVGTANAEGALDTIVRSDHVHAHGDQTVGSLHALVISDPGGTAGFMSPADKEKLDSLVGTIGATEFSNVTVSTTSLIFQDAFVGQNITIVETGAYLIMFEGNIEATNGNTVNEIGISNDTGGGPIMFTDSQRQMQGNGGAAISTFCHTFANLTAGDVVTGRFRRRSGSGTSSMDNRRMTVLRLNITP